MRGDAIPARVLSIQYIPHADSALLQALGAEAAETSLGILTMDSDDVGYSAVDEATKQADVRVLYARSMYAGAANASTALAGEFIGVLVGRDPESVRAGIESACRFSQEASFRSANEDNSIIYYAHCISRCGSYLAREAEVTPGSSLAYLIAPPNEAICGLDWALKAADVRLKKFYGPPSETNFAGGLLTGAQAACEAACRAFSECVCAIADRPIE